MRFNKIREAQVYKSADGKSWYLTGIASDNSVDRDGDFMSDEVLQSWAKQINEQGINFHGDHQHGLFDTLGVFNTAAVKNGKLEVTARLEDPDINPRVKQLLHKLDVGEKVGLSIGGDLTNSAKTWDGQTGTHVRKITGATLYEISAVGIPANGNAVVLGSVYKAAKPSTPIQLGESTDPSFPQMRGTNPPGKIATEPGKSGSSEVFRTDTGQKPSIYSDEDEAKADLERFYEELHGSKAEEMPSYQGGAAGIFGQGRKEDDEDEDIRASGNLNVRMEMPEMRIPQRHEEGPFAGRPGGAMGHREEDEENDEIGVHVEPGKPYPHVDEESERVKFFRERGAGNYSPGGDLRLKPRKTHGRA